MDKDTMIETGLLSELDVKVYLLTLPPPGLAMPAIARLAGRNHADVIASLGRLQAVCLVRADEAQRYLAVSPALAEAQALGADEVELSARRAELEARRMTIRQVMPQWTEQAHHSANGAAVEVVVDTEPIANVLMHYAETCQTEVLSVSPGQVPNRLDGRSRMATLFSLDRGVHTRAIYQQSALRDRAARSYLRELTDRGARVRVAGSVPLRSMVVDRETALVPMPSSDPNSPALAIIREPNVVAWFVATFEGLWTEAAPLTEVLGRDLSATELDQTRVAILRLMGEGEKDEAISRRLSVSVRTCRRHIADYMTQVGATSRFQAGVIAAREGHLDAIPLN
jgi:DNA-binding CsgD family transcriptional regulator